MSWTLPVPIQVWNARRLVVPQTRTRCSMTIHELTPSLSVVA